MEGRSSLLLSPAAALALALAGCAHPGRFRCPTEGGPAWIEVRSAHFRVVTDAPEEVGRRVADEMEQVRWAILAATWESRFDPPGVLEVVLLRTPAELDELTGTDRTRHAWVAGYFTRAERARIVAGLMRDREERALMLPGFKEELEQKTRRAESSVLKHELAHFLTHHVLQRQPLWLREGVATYFERTLVGTWHGKPAAVVGLVPWRTYITTENVANLIAGRDPDRLTAGLLVYWLMTERSAPFTAYQQRLGRGEDPVAAWRAEFPDLDPGSASAMERLADSLRAYWMGSSHPARRVLLPDLPRAALERTLAPAEVHALRAELLLPWRPDAAREELAESLREDASAVSAVVPLVALVRPPELLEAAARAANAHPDDWRAWLLFAIAARSRSELAGETLAALRRVAEAAPDDAWALNATARELTARGASAEVLPLAARAARLAPWSPRVLDTYGTVLRDVGRCGEALAVQNRAVALLGPVHGRPVDAPLPDDAISARAIRQHLAELESSCAGSAADHRP